MPNNRKSQGRLNFVNRKTHTGSGINVARNHAAFTPEPVDRSNTQSGFQKEGPLQGGLAKRRPACNGNPSGMVFRSGKSCTSSCCTLEFASKAHSGSTCDRTAVVSGTNADSTHTGSDKIAASRRAAQEAPLRHNERLSPQRL